MAQGARKLAQHGVGQHHRGQFAAGEHVAPDRYLVAGEVLDDPLVEPLVAPGQERQSRLAGELVDQRVVEQPPAGGQRDHAPIGPQLHRIASVARPQRGLDHIYA